MQLHPIVKCPKSPKLLHKIAYMHGYLPCPDVYVKCLCDSTEFFLERATKRNEIISVQRPEGRLSPFARLLLPTVARWQQIPSLSLHMSLPCLQPAPFERAASISYWGGFPTSAAQTLQVGPSQIRETRAVAPGPCTTTALTDQTVP